MRIWLKQLREEHQMSQQTLADMLDISQNYYSSIENGERQKKLSLPLANNLAKVFDVSEEWIIEQEKTTA